MYDFLIYSGGRVGIAVGDVSGKGAPAALFAALVGGMVRSMTSLEPSPAEMLTSINLSLNELRIDAQFVSMLYSVMGRRTAHDADCKFWSASTDLLPSRQDRDG